MGVPLLSAAVPAVLNDPVRAQATENNPKEGVRLHATFEPLPNAPEPLLLVDIDGVLSVFGWTGAPPEGTWTNVGGTVHLISTVAVANLLDLRSDFALAWCSGWEERANEHLPSLTGVGPLPYIDLDRSLAAGTSTPGHWKLAAIDRRVGPDRPVAWVDDDLNDACDRWAAARPGPTHLERTGTATGLDATAAANLRAFARGLR